MNAHLTEEQVNDQLLGLPEAAAAGHLESCARCQAEIDRVGAALGEFGRAAVAWSEHAPVRGGRRAASVVGMHNTGMRWAVAAVAVAAVALPVLRRVAPRPIAARAAVASCDSAEQIARDNLLLAAINSDLSEAVPAPMQPLSLGTETVKP